MTAEQGRVGELAVPTVRREGLRLWLFLALVVGLSSTIFAEAVRNMLENFRSLDSYYSHGYLVPFVSAFFAWRKREELARLSVSPSRLGPLVLALSCLMVLIGDFIGVRICAQLAMLVALVGLIASLWGWRHVWVLWFPIAFLLFMVPLPLSITQNVALKLKFFVLASTVQLTQLLMLPVSQDGSYLVFHGDRILIGEVCGGLRSLISLLALGAVMSYISASPSWVRAGLFALSVPVALAANASRVFLLSMVAYVWGSEAAVGWIHDASGVMIYAIAFALMLVLDRIVTGLTSRSRRGKTKEQINAC